jgi:RimJ/RimL family protein N-acetyltransferase
MNMIRNSSIQLRDVIESDLLIFYAHQKDPEANQMAAFKPREQDAFLQHWQKNLKNPSSFHQTILYQGEVAGNLVSFLYAENREIGYWVGKEFWGKGIATRALALFLQIEKTRPIFAMVAKDNVGSIRVLEKNGFQLMKVEKGFSEMRGEEIEESILKKE